MVERRGSSFAERFLRCCICLEHFEDPRLLPCFHSLCLHCLKGHVSSSAKKRRFRCPACRHECIVPEGGVGEIPKHFFLNSLKDFVNEGGDVSRMFRREEGRNLQHADGAGAGKDYAGKGEAVREKPGKHGAVCEWHTGQLINLFCRTCQVFICTACSLFKHKNHVWTELVDAVAMAHDRLLEMTNSACAYIESVDSMLTSLPAIEEEIRKDCQKAKKYIHQSARTLTQQLEVQEQDSLNKMRSIQEEAELQKARILSLQSYIDGLCASSDPIDKVAHTPGIKSQLEQLKVAQLQGVTWKGNFTEQIRMMSAVKFQSSLENSRAEPFEPRSSIPPSASCSESADPFKLWKTDKCVESPAEARESFSGPADRETSCSGAYGSSVFIPAAAEFEWGSCDFDEGHSGAESEESFHSTDEGYTPNKPSLAREVKASVSRVSRQLVSSAGQKKITTGKLLDTVKASVSRLLVSSVGQKKITLGKPFATVALSSMTNKAITGIVCLNNALCITQQDNERLVVYDTETWICQRYDIPELDGGTGIALVDSKKGKIAVAGNNGQLHFLRIQLDPISVGHHRTVSIPMQKPRRISVDAESGSILVGSQGSQFVIHRGKTNIKINLPIVDGEEYCAWSVVKTNGGYAATVTKFGGKIVWISEKQEVIHIYGEEERDEFLRFPQQIVRDNRGRLIVVDRSKNRLHLIGSDKKLEQYLLTWDDGLRHPTCIFLDEEAGLLCVGHGKDDAKEVRLYHWPVK